MEHIYDMVIIGGGPGGYTAALYAARAGLDVLVLEKGFPGGQMALTLHVENYPGFGEGVDGFSLGDRMRRDAERFGAKTELGEVISLDLRADPKKIVTGSGMIYGRTVVYAAGAGPRKLGLPGEEVWTGRGISYCAACDGMLYKGKHVVVVGGGNSAVGDAIQLSRIAERVTVIHRRDSFRGERKNHDQLLAAGNVQVLWNTVVTRIQGDQTLKGVSVRNVRTGEEMILPCDGVFISIGRKPETELVNNQLQLDSSGYILADESTRASLPGVYAVGDVRAKPLRQIVTAAADGAVASHFAQEYLGEIQGNH